MKVDHRSDDAIFAVVKRKQRSRVWIPYKPEFFFLLGFLFTTAQVFYNCNDLLSYNSSARSSHIWFLYIHVQLTSIKIVLIQSLFLCCKIYTYTGTWSIKLSDYLSFNLVAFFSASVYGSNTNCTLKANF